MKSVVFLMGPTASGKSKLAMDLSKVFPCDLISVDSAMIYRGMDIGTAKPSKEELTRFPHQLIDIKDPSESYSVAKFYQDAMHAIEHSHAQNKLPILVGGTMLYFNALRKGLSTLPSADVDLRKKIEEQAKQIGWPALHQKLKDIDPESYERIKPTDSQRISRALEVYELTGQSLTSLWGQSSQQFPYHICALALMPSDRKFLHDDIARRLHFMMENGFLEEVKSLYQNPTLNESLPSIRSVGYRQIWQYLQGHISLEQAVEKAIVSTRQLAKRQITWLRSWSDLAIFLREDPQLLAKVTDLIEAECYK
jgi:tRNA dimethylallyltransferase